MPIGAIILAGGTARRLGGASKPDLELNGRRLLDIVLDAVGDSGPRVVVGPPELEVPQGVRRVQEDPPFSGPAAAIATGLAALGEPGAKDAPEAVLLLACDLPAAGQAVARLRGSTGPDGAPPGDGVILVSPDGQREWLAALVRTNALHEAVRRLGTPQNRPVHTLLTPLALHEVWVTADVVADIDTWQDHRDWANRNRSRSRSGQAAADNRGTAPGQCQRPPVTQQPDWEPTLRPWLERACTELTLDPESFDVNRLHQMTGEVAHRLQRSMAPIAAYLVGAALAQGHDMESACRVVEQTLPEGAP